MAGSDINMAGGAANDAHNAAADATVADADAAAAAAATNAGNKSTALLKARDEILTQYKKLDVNPGEIQVRFNDEEKKKEYYVDVLEKAPKDDDYTKKCGISILTSLYRVWSLYYHSLQDKDKDGAVDSFKNGADTVDIVDVVTKFNTGIPEKTEGTSTPTSNGAGEQPPAPAPGGPPGGPPAPAASQPAPDEPPAPGGPPGGPPAAGTSTNGAGAGGVEAENADDVEVENADDVEVENAGGEGVEGGGGRRTKRSRSKRSRSKRTKRSSTKCKRSRSKRTKRSRSKRSRSKRKRSSKRSGSKSTKRKRSSTKCKRISTAH